jgi:hypothetical protein
MLELKISAHSELLFSLFLHHATGRLSMKWGHIMPLWIITYYLPENAFEN